jgi:ureidoacrylate peracid hydrolase
MSGLTYEKELVALLVVDPYNDFISEGGKVWGRVKEVAEGVNCVPNMRRLLQTSRTLGLRIFFVPHHRWRDGDYATWKNLAPVQERANNRKTFQYGTWGGEFHPDFQPLPNEIVAQEHWCSSGFANTDLDLLLKRHGIQQLIIIGLLANTCIESTMRFAVELGYRATLVKDAIASLSWDEMKATLEINAPAYANAIVSTEELISQLTAQFGATIAQ